MALLPRPVVFTLQRRCGALQAVVEEQRRELAAVRADLAAARDEMVRLRRELGELRRHRQQLARAVRGRSTLNLPPDVLALIEEEALGE